MLRFRFLSWAVDLAVLTGAFLVANMIHQLLGVLWLVAGTTAYYVWLVGGPRGATLGHQLARLRVVDAETLTGVTPQRAALRLAINAVLVIPFALPLLLNIHLATRHRGQLLHDLGTGTVAVRSG